MASTPAEGGRERSPAESLAAVTEGHGDHGDSNSGFLAKG